MAGEPSARTVQNYIDERPSWADGTPCSAIPMTAMQWRIWWLAAAGKFFEGLVVFMTGVALPLVAMEFNLDATHKGMVGAATLFGILVGATALGGLVDRVGRKPMFIVEMGLFTVFLFLVALSPNLTWLFIGLVGLGVSLGCDYPTAHLIISESIASTNRGRLVLSAFGFQALGALTGTAVGLIVLDARTAVTDWRWMYASAILPAMLVLVGRFFIPQSGHWLVTQGRIAEAERQLQRLLRRTPPYPQNVQLRIRPEHGKGNQRSYVDLFLKKHRRATILASVPWFLQDLGTYGIGIFTPTILAATIGPKTGHTHNLAGIIYDDVLASRGAALIDALLIVGIAGAVWLADKVGRMRLQIFGFIGCAVGLFLASLSVYCTGPTRTVLVFAGFMVFNFMTNLGPNATTYLIAGEVFPTHMRGIGAGFAASFAKIGAVLTSFLFPILLVDLGPSTLLSMLVGTSLLGALITWRFAIESRGISLETIGQGPTVDGEDETRGGVSGPAASCPAAHVRSL
jgi:MFS transporter, putative metabolite transport protein